MFRPRSGYLTSVLAATLLMSGCSLLDSRSDSSIEVSGEALYRERIMLPPDSMLEIRLEDISRADAPASMLSQQLVPNPGTPPYAFSFQVDPEHFQPNHRYSLRASIRQGNSLLFTTDTVYAVTPEQNQGHTLIMKRVQQTAEQPDVNLTETYWKLVQLNDETITTGEEQREPHLILKANNRAQGFSGCNQFMGQYQASATTLSFGPIAGTLKACVPTITYETHYLRFLNGELEWKVSGDQLKLHDPVSGNTAEFKAVHLQ